MARDYSHFTEHGRKMIEVARKLELGKHYDEHEGVYYIPFEEVASHAEELHTLTALGFKGEVRNAYDDNGEFIDGKYWLCMIDMSWLDEEGR